MKLNRLLSIVFVLASMAGGSLAQAIKPGEETTIESGVLYSSYGSGDSTEVIPWVTSTQELRFSAIRKSKLVTVDSQGKLISSIETGYYLSGLSIDPETNLALAFDDQNSIRVFDLNNFSFNTIPFSITELPTYPKYWLMKNSAQDLRIVLHYNKQINGILRSVIAIYSVQDAKLLAETVLDARYDSVIHTPVVFKQNGETFFTYALEYDDVSFHYALFTISLSTGKIIAERNNTSCNIENIADKTAFVDGQNFLVMQSQTGCVIRDQKDHFFDGVADASNPNDRNFGIVLIDPFSLEIKKAMNFNSGEDVQCMGNCYKSPSVVSLNNKLYALAHYNRGMSGVTHPKPVLVDLLSEKSTIFPQLVDSVFNIQAKLIGYSWEVAEQFLSTYVCKSVDIEKRELLVQYSFEEPSNGFYRNFSTPVLLGNGLFLITSKIVDKHFLINVLRLF